MSNHNQAHEDYMLHQFRQEQGTGAQSATMPAQPGNEAQKAQPEQTVSTMPAQPNSSLWRKLHGFIPWLVAAYAWLWWAAFMVLSSLIGAHDAHYFTPFENFIYCMLGLVLCLTTTVAARDDNALVAVWLAASVHMLSYWF